MPIANKMIDLVASSSIIQEMFEGGLRLKQKYGDDKVFDFSLGNPDVAPPRELKQALKDLVNDESLSHGYMPSPGYPHVREIVADYLNEEFGLKLRPELVIMSVGAIGAINTVLKTLVNPGEEIVTPAPCFVGYSQYAFNANASVRTASSDDRFHLNMNAIEEAITGKTRVMIINSPNNPTGVVYSADELNQLGRLLESASQRFGKRIYLLSDEPYRKIAYEVDVPSVFAVYPHTIVITSFSKELSIAGERIGYLAIHPEAEDAQLIASACNVVNTMLYGNAPSLMQLAISKLLGIVVDISVYRRRRDLLCDGLKSLGYEFQIPQGAFYLFPRSPIENDIEFTRVLREELVLVTPGTAFAGSGHFRISYAVPEQAIERSMNGFKRAMEKV